MGLVSPVILNLNEKETNLIQFSATDGQCFLSICEVEDQVKNRLRSKGIQSPDFSWVIPGLKRVALYVFQGLQNFVSTAKTSRAPLANRMDSKRILITPNSAFIIKGFLQQASPEWVCKFSSDPTCTWSLEIWLSWMSLPPCLGLACTFWQIMSRRRPYMGSRK